MIFESKWIFFSWILFHKKTTITKPDYCANDLYIENKISIIRPNITEGNDNHISFENEKEVDEILSKIRQNRLKWNQLQLLENPHLSILEKILIVKELEKDNIDSSYVSNIHKGGLWKDWDG